MSLSACTVEGVTYAVAHLKAGSPAAVPGLLLALRQSADANIDAASASDEAASVPGATPYAQARRIKLIGVLPDRSPVVHHVVILARGTTVVQAGVLGVAPGADEVDTFFEGLAFLPP